MKGVQAVSRQVRQLLSAEGKTSTPLPYLTLYRFTTPTITMPQTGNFYVYVILDGSLRLYTPSGILDYEPGQYSVSQIDTPDGGYVQAFSSQGDFLALSLEFTLQDIISVVLDLEGDLPQQIADAALEVAVMEDSDRRVISSLSRLLEALRQPTVQLSFLGSHIRREIIFYILCGSCGSQFLQSAVNIQQAGEIYEINRWIKENFRHSFTVEELAKKRNMSVSLFHQKFKNAVGMGPLQCQKRLRLTEARRLMLDENKNVTEASLEVGYESVSQFTRDYRKMFGAAPKDDLLRLHSQKEK